MSNKIVLHWRKEKIENVVVPIVDYGIQPGQQISELIEKKFLPLRRK